jgi:hypothetical protein
MDAALRRLIDAVTEVAGIDRSGGVPSEELVGLLLARERLDAVILAAVGVWDRAKAWELDGARSPVAWLAHRAPVTRQEASTLLRTARHVHRFESTAKALDVGDISVSHATIAAQAAKHRDDRYREHEDTILDAGRQLPPAGFRQVMAYWRVCADAHDDADTAQDQYEGSYLDVNTTFDGIAHLDGRLDPISARTLIECLDRLEPPDAGDGPTRPRTLSQRRAAALVRLAAGDRAPKVRIDILMDHDTFAGRPPIDPRTGCCELARGGSLSPALVRTVACDAAIGRIVMHGESEVLDVGRRTHLVTPALRRALHARDRQCVEPGCDIPAHWCDAHHVVPWQAHGPTSLDNLELRCRRHHLATHRHDHRQRRERRQE